MSSDKFSTFRLVVAILVFICLAGATAALNSRTLVPFIAPASVCAGIAIVSGLRWAGIWRWLTGSSRKWLNYCCHVLCTSCVLLFAFYGLNYFLADDGTLHEEKAVVTAKYKQTRYKSRRIRRNVYGRGEPYTVYCINLRFECGVEKERELKAASYRRTHTGDTITQKVERGLFGVSVVK